MATNPPKRQAPKPKSAVIEWLLDSDPSIRWQVMRDLTDAPADEVAAQPAKVATEGRGAGRSLARRPTAPGAATPTTPNGPAALGSCGCATSVWTGRARGLAGAGRR